jgi:hypothetical protein
MSACTYRPSPSGTPSPSVEPEPVAAADHVLDSVEPKAAQTEDYPVSEEFPLPSIDGGLLNLEDAEPPPIGLAFLITEENELPSIDWGLLTIENTAQTLLEAILQGNYIAVARLMSATSSDAYRFIEEMVVDSYEIVEAISTEYLRFYKIKLHVSRGDNTYFPVGESYWDLCVQPVEVTGPIRHFARSHDESIIDESDIARITDKEIMCCYNFSLSLDVYQSATDFNTLFHTPSQSSTDLYNSYGTSWPSEDKPPFEQWWLNSRAHRAIHYYLDTSPILSNNVSVDELNEYMLKTAGITNPDYSGSSYHRVEVNEHGEELEFIECYGHGGNWKYWKPFSILFDDDSGIYTVVLDYYADQAMVVIAKTIQYQFTMLNDGAYSMISTELLYDSGFNMAWDAI